MKKTIFATIIAFSQTVCSAQITISNNYFPNNGDSLVTATATAQTVSGIRISKAATTVQSWNYNFLRARTPTTRTIDRFRALNPVTDTAILREFPNATTVIADSTGQIDVYRRSTTRFDLLGYFNARLGFLPVVLRPKFNPPSLERRAPLIFNSTNINQTGFSVPFSTDIIPDTIFANLPIRPDSLRIRFTTNRQDKVDAFGKIRIPGSGELDCLRERRYEVTETHIDAKSNNIPFWIDITALIPLGNLKTKDTTLVFQFWSDLYKEPLLTIRADNDSTPISAVYKWLPINAPTDEMASNISAVLFPIPAKDVVNIHIEGIASENYLLNIVDYTGRMLLTKEVKNPNDVVQLQINTSRWATGVYFLNLYSETNKSIVLTKTFMIER